MPVNLAVWSTWSGSRRSPRRPELPVILTTGYTNHASEVAAEGFALIEKPYRRDVLAASLRSALEKRGPSVSETLTGF